MARKRSTQPTDAELQILRVLWTNGPLALGQVHRKLAEQRPIAKTTVATVLGVMLEKKLVKRSRTSAGYLWAAGVDRRLATSGMVSKLLERVFDGSAARMVTHLLEDGRISDEELEEIARLRRQERARPGEK